MDQISYKTTYVNKATAQKEWVLIDAENQVVGRLAAKVAKLLRGKYKPSYTPHVDCGDNVIIINVEKVIFTGNKLTDKQYRRHTQYPGGQRISTPAEEMKRFPERIAVFKNMHLFVGPEHNHESQQPKVIDINALK